jgi:hypothetical protein
VRGLGTRDRVLAMVVPVLLVLVAGYQIGTAMLADQTPWRGGGFGMFATSDHVDLRVLRVTFATDSETVAVDVPSLLAAQDPRHGRAHINLRARPSAQHAGHLAASLAGTVWTVTEDVARLEPAEEAPSAFGPVLLDAAGQSSDVRTVRSEVWRVTYQRGDGWIRPELLATHVRDVEDGA